MSSKVSERSFEAAIECGLLQYGPDACAEDASAVREMASPYGDRPPGGYRKRRPEYYDRALCLMPRDVVDFVLATQPKEWEKLKQHHGAAVKEQFLKRLASEIERRGALDRVRRELSAESRAGVPELEGNRSDGIRRLLRQEWAGDGEASTRERAGVHSDPLWCAQA